MNYEEALEMIEKVADQFSALSTLNKLKLGFEVADEIINSPTYKGPLSPWTERRVRKVGRLGVSV